MSLVRVGGSLRRDGLVGGALAFVVEGVALLDLCRLGAQAAINDVVGITSRRRGRGGSGSGGGRISSGRGVQDGVLGEDTGAEQNDGEELHIRRRYV